MNVFHPIFLSTVNRKEKTILTLLSSYYHCISTLHNDHLTHSFIAESWILYGEDRLCVFTMYNVCIHVCV